MIQINIEFNREIYICETTVVELQFVEQLMDFNDNNVSKSQAPNNDSKSRDSNLEKMDANKMYNIQQQLKHMNGIQWLFRIYFWMYKYHRMG